MEQDENGNYLLPSQFIHDDEVQFRPMYRHRRRYGISDEWFIGTIVGIRFTKAKVFYDIVDDYYGRLYANIDSAKVRKGGVIPTTFVDPEIDSPDEPTSSDN